MSISRSHTGRVRDRESRPIGLHPGVQGQSGSPRLKLIEMSVSWALTWKKYKTNTIGAPPEPRFTFNNYLFSSMGSKHLVDYLDWAEKPTRMFPISRVFFCQMKIRKSATLTATYSGQCGFGLHNIYSLPQWFTGRISEMGKIYQVQVKLTCNRPTEEQISSRIWQC